MNPEQVSSPASHNEQPRHLTVSGLFSFLPHSAAFTIILFGADMASGG